MGKLRALYACANLVRQNPKLKSILLIGFAGGLTSHLKIGDVIEPTTFIEQDYNAEPLEKFPNMLVRKGAKRFLGESRDAVMLTQDRFLKSNPYKHTPYEKKFKAIACDMESYAVAFFCEKLKMKYAVVKIISDCADESADHDFLKACRELSPKLNRLTLELVGVLS